MHSRPGIDGSSSTLTYFSSISKKLDKMHTCKAGLPYLTTVFSSGSRLATVFSSGSCLATVFSSGSRLATAPSSGPRSENLLTSWQEQRTNPTWLCRRRILLIHFIPVTVVVGMIENILFLVFQHDNIIVPLTPATATGERSDSSLTPPASPWVMPSTTPKKVDACGDNDSPGRVNR